MNCETIRALADGFLTFFKGPGGLIVGLCLGLLLANPLSRVVCTLKRLRPFSLPSFASLIEKHTIVILLLTALLIPPATQLLICLGYGGGQFQAKDLLDLYGAVIGVGATIGTFLWARAHDLKTRKAQITPAVQISLSSSEDTWFVFELINTREYPAFNLLVEGLPVVNALLPQTSIYRKIRYVDHEPPKMLKKSDHRQVGDGETLTQIYQTIEFNKHGLPSEINVQYTDVDRASHSQSLRPIQDGSNIYA